MNSYTSVRTSFLIYIEIMQPFLILSKSQEASKCVLRIIKKSKQKFRCKYSRFRIRKIGCLMTWARYKLFFFVPNNLIGSIFYENSKFGIRKIGCLMTWARYQSRYVVSISFLAINFIPPKEWGYDCIFLGHQSMIIKKCEFRFTGFFLISRQYNYFIYTPPQSNFIL